MIITASNIKCIPLPLSDMTQIEYKHFRIFYNHTAFLLQFFFSMSSLSHVESRFFITLQKMPYYLVLCMCICAAGLVYQGRLHKLNSSTGFFYFCFQFINFNSQHRKSLSMRFNFHLWWINFTHLFCSCCGFNSFIMWLTVWIFNMICFFHLAEMSMTVLKVDEKGT